MFVGHEPRLSDCRRGRRNAGARRFIYFRRKNIGKQECEEELEKEFKEIKMIKLNKNPIGKLTIGSNFGLLSDFKKAKECIYLDINGECIGLSFSEWDLLNQYIEKLRKFK